jgi:hypothetical protein
MRAGHLSCQSVSAGPPASLSSPLAVIVMRKLILTSIGVGVVMVSFLIGRWWGSGSAAERLMQEEMMRYGKFSDLDRSVLPSVPARSNVMTSGAYLMDVWFSGTHLGPREVNLQCENGTISIPAPNTFTRSGGSQTLSVKGSVVSWTQEGAGYEANPKYVGLVDGDEMWGRVYGWSPGDQSVGLWRIYPKPSKTGQQDGAANGSQPIRSETNRTSSAAGSRR